MIEVFTPSITLGSNVYNVRYFSLEKANHIVDFKYTSAGRYFETCVNNPTNRPGYRVVGAFNGGAFYSNNGKPFGSLQIRNSSGNMVEYGDGWSSSNGHDYGSGTYGVGIVNDKLRKTFIYGVDASDLVNPDMLRTAYGFSFIYENGSLNYQLSSNRYNEAFSIYHEEGIRIGIAFKNNIPYVFKTFEEVTGDVLGQLLIHEGFNYYVNMDGGFSASLYVNNGYISNTVRQLHETFYLMERE